MSLIYVSMSIILALKNSKGLVLDFLTIDKAPRIIH